MPSEQTQREWRVRESEKEEKKRGREIQSEQEEDRGMFEKNSRSALIIQSCGISQRFIVIMVGRND